MRCRWLAFGLASGFAVLGFFACEAQKNKPRTTTISGARKANETAHPRILLDSVVLERIRRNAKAETPMWKSLKIECDEYAQTNKSSGYQGLYWGEAVADLSVCFYATGDKRYQARAVDYARGLLFDKAQLGDNQGGEMIVRGDSGYPIRAYGVYTALAYDWLHDAPGMAELRPVMLERLHDWLAWYKKAGYLNDQPTSNYFWGYFTALSTAALATAGETDDAAAWLSDSQKILQEKIIPQFRERLAGGEWAEGWQYGTLVAQEVAWVVKAYETAIGANYLPSLPWLEEVVSAFQFRVVPGGNAMYGNSTHEERPAKANGFALAAILLAIDQQKPEIAAHARFLLKNVYPNYGRERIWFPFLADDPSAKVTSPHKENVLSYQLAGPGQTFLRSSWDKNAVWVAYQAGPRLAIDHQHHDQGHFEIWQGATPLLADFGVGDAYATSNHNSILIEDGGKVLNYSPNQGLWGKNVKTTGFRDDGAVAVITSDLTDAWNPKCVEDGCDARAVSRVSRTVIFYRPNIVITWDSVALTDASSQVTWAAHASFLPRLGGNGQAGALNPAFTVNADAASLQIFSLPVSGETNPVVLKEPTPTRDHIFMNNSPQGDVWRMELRAKPGQKLIEMLTWMNVGAAGSLWSASHGGYQSVQGSSSGTGAADVLLSIARDDRTEATVRPDRPIARWVIVGLSAGKHYTISKERDVWKISASAQGALIADQAGTVVIEKP